MPQPGLDKRPFATFRVTKVPWNHPALEGRDLRPLDPQPKFFEPNSSDEESAVD